MTRRAIALQRDAIPASLEVQPVPPCTGVRGSYPATHPALPDGPKIPAPGAVCGLPSSNYLRGTAIDRGHHGTAAPINRGEKGLCKASFESAKHAYPGSANGECRLGRAPAYVCSIRSGEASGLSPACWRKSPIFEHFGVSFGLVRGERPDSYSAPGPKHCAVAAPGRATEAPTIQRVLFNGRTSASQADDVGSIPITRSNK